MIKLKSLLLENEYELPVWNSQFHDIVKRNSNDRRNDDESFAKQNFDKIVEHLKSLNGNDCFRGMSLNKTIEFVKLRNIGEHWAETFDAAEDFVLNESEIMPNDQQIIFQGMINIDYLNWKMTILHRMYYKDPITEGEVELIFIPNSPIRVEKIFKFYSNTKQWGMRTSLSRTYRI